jgi:HEAT repeat protein
MMRTDLEVANDFVHRWLALRKDRRARLGKEIPIAAVQVTALCHPDPAMRRFCLSLLDHYASEASADTFRRALHDPVQSVREGALHGLACESCRDGDICVTDVVTDLAEILVSDPNAEVRHKTIAALARFMGRDSRAGEAIARAADHDSDPAIRCVARAVADSGLPHVGRRKAALRHVRRAKRHERELRARVGAFSAGDRLPREEVHQRGA